MIIHSTAALVLTFQRYSNICPRYVYPALFAFGLSIIDTIFLSIFFKVHAKLVCFFVGESCLLRNHCRKRSAAPPLWLPLPNLTFIHSTFSGWGKVKPVLTFSAWCFWFSLVLSDSPQLKDWRKMSIPICVRLVQSSMSEVLASVPGWPGLFHLPVSLLRHGVHSNLPNAPQVQLLYLSAFHHFSMKGLGSHRCNKGRCSFSLDFWWLCCKEVLYEDFHLEVNRRCFPHNINPINIMWWFLAYARTAFHFILPFSTQWLAFCWSCPALPLWDQPTLSQCCKY